MIFLSETSISFFNLLFSFDNFSKISFIGSDSKGCSYLLIIFFAFLILSLISFKLFEHFKIFSFISFNISF